MFRYSLTSKLFYRNVIGNILLFVPFGYFVSYYCKLPSVKYNLLITVITSTSIETIQSAIGRSFDIDDIILNVVGGICGFLLYIGLNAIRNHLPKIFRRNFFDFSCSFATYSIPCSKLSLIASRNNCLYVHSDYYNYYEKNIST